jgi:hypothetical protein
VGSYDDGDEVEKALARCAVQTKIGDRSVRDRYLRKQLCDAR